MNEILWFWLFASILVVIAGTYFLLIKFDLRLLAVVGAFAILLPFIVIVGTKKAEE